MNSTLSDNSKQPFTNLSEQLLDAWLSLSTAVRNERLVQSMTFREIFVCNILYQEQSNGNVSVTATDIVQRTGMLKSQANKVLCSLESHNIIGRTRSDTDKRQIHIRLTHEGVNVYLQEHRRILNLLDQLIEKMGPDTISHFVNELKSAAGAMQKLTHPDT